MITVNGLSKFFRVVRRGKGTAAAFRALFSREYDVVAALRDVSFSVADGEVVGYIGPNGAGKSTTIKVLSGILRPDGGSCVIDGRVPWQKRREHVAHIGVVFGQRTQLWWDVPVMDSYDLLCDIYRVPRSEYRKNLDRLIGALDIGGLLSTPLRQLSLGQRMRCELAGSLLHAPRLLFLDEPTIGLDAVSKLAVRAFIGELQKERGVTVILTTHDMADIEALTDRIVLIGKGQILFDGSLRAVRSRHDTTREIEAAFEHRGELPAIPGAELIFFESGRARWQASAADAPAVMTRISDRLSPSDISVQGASVEQLIARLYGEYKL